MSNKFHNDIFPLNTCKGKLKFLGNIFIDGQDWNVYHCKKCKKVLWQTIDGRAAFQGELSKKETIKEYF